MDYYYKPYQTGELKLEKGMSFDEEAEKKKKQKEESKLQWNRISSFILEMKEKEEQEKMKKLLEEIKEKNFHKKRRKNDRRKSSRNYFAIKSFHKDPETPCCNSDIFQLDELKQTSTPINFSSSFKRRESINSKRSRLFQSTKYSSFHGFDLGLEDELFKIDEDNDQENVRKKSKINFNLEQQNTNQSTYDKLDSFKLTENTCTIMSPDILHTKNFDQSPKKKDNFEFKFKPIRVNDTPIHFAKLNADIDVMNNTNFKIKLKSINKPCVDNDVSKIYTSYGMPAIRKDLNDRIQKFLRQSNDRSRKYCDSNKEGSKSFKFYDYFESSKKIEFKHKTKFSIDIGRRK